MVLRNHRLTSNFRNETYKFRGFTVLELLTVTGVISVLLAVILPALGSAREAARHVQCTSQLKQIGLALHSYHETCGAFPPGWQWESKQRSAYGWGVPLLPYLDQHAIFELVDRNSILESLNNTHARATTIPILLCPSDITEATFTLYWEDESTEGMFPLIELPTANYVGVFGTLEPDEDELPITPVGDGTFIEARSIRLADLQRGTSNVVVVGERTMERLPSTWLGIDRTGDDAPCQLVGNAMTSPNCEICDECEFSSRHPGGTNFLWADGHISFLSDAIDSAEYRKLSRRAVR